MASRYRHRTHEAWRTYETSDLCVWTLCQCYFSLECQSSLPSVSVSVGGWWKRRSICHPRVTILLIALLVGGQHLVEKLVGHAASNELVLRQHSVLVFVHLAEDLLSASLWCVGRVVIRQLWTHHVVDRLQTRPRHSSEIQSSNARKLTNWRISYVYTSIVV